MFQLHPRKVNFSFLWEKLRTTAQNVLAGKPVKKDEYTDCFMHVYRCCTAIPDAYTRELYVNTRDLILSHVNSISEMLLNIGDEDVLCVYNTQWEIFCLGSKGLDRLFHYVNRLHQRYNEPTPEFSMPSVCCREEMTRNIMGNDATYEIGEMAYAIWYWRLLEPFLPRLRSLINSVLRAHRQGEVVPDETCQHVRGAGMSLVNVLKYQPKEQMEIYDEKIVSPIMHVSEEFYKDVAAELFEKNTISEYLCKARDIVQEEKERACIFLHPDSGVLLQRVVGCKMVVDRMDAILQEARALMSSESLEDLRALYALFDVVSASGMQRFVALFLEHVKGVAAEAVRNVYEGAGGKDIGTSSTLPFQFVEAACGVHRKYESLITSIFGGSSEFRNALSLAMQHAINWKPAQAASQAPSLLAKYADVLLRRNIRNVTEEELEKQLSRSITVFCYLDDKDIYQGIYSRLLAKRLISNSSVSMALEELMANKLKEVCGYEFTNKIHRMLMDVSLSTDLTSKFLTEHLPHLRGIGFSVMVLQTGSWPIQQPAQPSLNIPPELAHCMELLETFYKSEHRGRRLTWMHTLGSVDMKLHVAEGRTYFVSMHPYQMVCLLPFNDQLTCTVRVLQEASGLPNHELHKQLQALIDSELLIAEKREISAEENSKVVDINTSDDDLAKIFAARFLPETVLHFNVDYTNKRTKFKLVNAIREKDVPQEIEKTQRCVEEDRKLYLQACIVRTMKTSKRIRHNLLVQTVIEQSQSFFTPSVPVIKRCVEILIEKGYIERNADRPDEYDYLA